MSDNKKIVAVRFFCTKCGKEIWKGLAKDVREAMTVKEAERTAICWDCLNKEEGFVPELEIKSSPLSVFPKLMPQPEENKSI